MGNEIIYLCKDGDKKERERQEACNSHNLNKYRMQNAESITKRQRKGDFYNECVLSPAARREQESIIEQ